MEKPYTVLHLSYYEYLLGCFRRLEGLMDTHLVLAGNEVASAHGFVLSALCGCVQSLPRLSPLSSPATTYLVLRELDAWGVRCLLEYFYSGTLVIPKQNLPCMNRILQALDVSLGSEFFESEDAVHFSLSQTLKCTVIDVIWLNREHNFDVKILTEGMRETFAHAAVLSACSEQLSTLFRAAQGCRPSLIVLLDFDMEDVECVLKFCYKGKVDIPCDRATQVCKLAKILGIKKLYDTVSHLSNYIDSVSDTNCSNKIVTKISCWEHSETTKKIFRTLFEKESLSDIQLICSDHTFKVHSAVLNLSPYFKPLFELCEWRHSVIYLSQLSFDTVQAFVDYMYYGEVCFTGGINEFAIAMNGLIDFSVLPANTVEPQWETVVHSTQPQVTQFEPPVPVPPPQMSVFTAEPTNHNENPLEIKETSTPLTYICDTCAAIFYSRRSLKIHLKSHPESHSTQCSYCDQKFAKPSVRRIHERSHTGVRPHVCQTCGKTYSTQSALGKHKRTVHNAPQQVFECALCSRTCSRKEYLEEHIRTHTGSKPFRCTICGKGFVGKTGLNHHSKVHGPPRKDSVCEVCGKAFTRKALWTHMKTHDKQYKCETCNKLFSTPGTLKTHMAMTHQESRLLPCEICGKKFALQNQLNRHRKTVHNPDRGFPCTSCDKVLNTEARLRSHERTSHAVSPRRYDCDMCDRKFAGRSALVYHQRTHTGIRPHACSLCPKTFLRPDALHKHERSHSREKPYHCSLCEQRCSSKSALNKHMKRHAQPPAAENQQPQQQIVLVPQQNNYIEVVLPMNEAF